MVTKVENDFNKLYLNISSELFNDGIHDFRFSSCIETFVDIVSVILYIKLNIPESPNDQKYQKVFFQTVCDIKKIINGTSTNFITRSIMEKFSTSVDFELKLPFKKVRIITSNYFQIFITKEIQGIYRYTNVSISETLLPLPNTKLLLELRFVGKIAGKKSTVFISLMKFYSEIKR